MLGRRQSHLGAGVGGSFACTVFRLFKNRLVHITCASDLQKTVPQPSGTWLHSVPQTDTKTLEGGAFSLFGFVFLFQREITTIQALPLQADFLSPSLPIRSGRVLVYIFRIQTIAPFFTTY